ncbi:hypothetical protein DFP72DRAFT_1050795 [Ephemerocybe angulata]|uniref:Uncharacterized protein n=1 Tax=Ephemerocybe angulata TaxID=980116 RepID=A0A8H6HHR8_9AGAR|nr:hypothetical protein DFP72DRAFT_1050795 [Tulosesus angulatus]
MSSSPSDGFFDGWDDTVIGTTATSVTDGFSEPDSLNARVDDFCDEVRQAVGGSASNATDELTEPDPSVSEGGARTIKPLAEQGKDVDDDIRPLSGASAARRPESQKRRSMRPSGEVMKVRTSDVAAEVLTFCIQKDEEKKGRFSKERTSETRPLSPKNVKIVAKPAVWNDPFMSSDPKMRRDYIAYCTTCELWLGDESEPRIRRMYNEHRRTPVHIEKYKDAMDWNYTTPLGRSGEIGETNNSISRHADIYSPLCYNELVLGERTKTGDGIARFPRLPKSLIFPTSRGEVLSLAEYLIELTDAGQPFQFRILETVKPEVDDKEPETPLRLITSDDDLALQAITAQQGVATSSPGSVHMEKENSPEPPSPKSPSPHLGLDSPPTASPCHTPTPSEISPTEAGSGGKRKRTSETPPPPDSESPQSKEGSPGQKGDTTTIPAKRQKTKRWYGYMGKNGEILDEPPSADGLEGAETPETKPPSPEKGRGRRKRTEVKSYRV